MIHYTVANVHIHSEVYTYTHWTNLYISLLNETDPELIIIAGVGAEEFVVVTHWETIIYHHLQTHRHKHE